MVHGPLRSLLLTYTKGFRNVELSFHWAAFVSYSWFSITLESKHMPTPPYLFVTINFIVLKLLTKAEFITLIASK
jgi:hypothetical protein